MTVVRFAAYRQYDAVRTEASNAMMALLAGAQLASHMLQLTEGSERLLPEVFPRVPHIGRFNLTSEAARRILDAADTHLGAMSVPYALSIHEDYLKTCLGLLERGKRLPAGTAEKTKFYQQHRQVSWGTGGAFSAESLMQLETLRLMRNCTIHEGGRASQALVTQLRGWSAGAESGWVRLAKRSPRYLRVGAPVSFGHAELILTLAVTKGLAREANELLQPALPRSLWADLVVEDLISGDPHVVRAPDTLRRARGLARHHYAPLHLGDLEIAEGLARG